MKRILAIAFLASCAQSADDLTPFPCATDKTCPAGLACVGDVCMAAQLDALCTTGDDPTNCAAAGPNAVCAIRPADRNAPLAVGACEVPCSPGCPAGRACSSTGAGGMCLIDCTDGTACPDNTVCMPRNFDSRKVCVPPGVAVEQCQSLVNPQICNLCGTSAVNTEVCPNGTSTCPHGSTCSADSAFCMCGPGTQAVDCTGQPCNGQCSANNWWCQPETAIASCSSDRFELSGTCHCFDGRNINFGCMSAMTCEDACEL